MADFDVIPTGSDLATSYAIEKRDGIPRATWFKINSQGFDPRMLPVVGRNDNLDPSRQMLRGRNVAKRWLGKSINSRPDVNTEAPLRASHLGMFAIDELVADEVYDWTMRPWQRGLTPPAYCRSISFQTDQGDDRPQIVTGCRQSDLELVMQGGQLAQVNRTFNGAHNTFLGDPVMVVDGGTYTGTPRARGHLAVAHAGKTLKAKVTTEGGSGVAEIKLDVDAGLYTGAARVVTFDTWMRFTLANGAVAGISRKDDVWLYFESGGTLSLNDEFEIEPTRTFTYTDQSTRDVLISAGFFATIGGVEVKAPPFSASLKISRPHQTEDRLSLYLPTIPDSGVIMLEVEIEQDYQSRDFFDAWQRDEDLSPLILLLEGDPIGATGYFEEWEFSLPKPQIEDAGAPIDGPETQRENLKVLAYTADSGTTASWTERVRCTLPHFDLADLT